MTPNDKLPEEMALEYSLKGSWSNYSHPQPGKVFYPGTGQAETYSRYLDGYKAAWAHWKVKHDELQAAIDDKIDKALHAERNAMQAKMTEMEIGYLKQIQRMADALEAVLPYLKAAGTNGNHWVPQVEQALQGKGIIKKEVCTCDNIQLAAHGECWACPGRLTKDGKGKEATPTEQEIEAEVTRRWNSIGYNPIGTRTRESYREGVIRDLTNPTK